MAACRENIRKAHKRNEELREDPAWRASLAQKISRAKLEASAGPLPGLRKERMARGLTRAELGDMAGLSASSIGLYERSRGGASREALARISRVLDVPEEKLTEES